MVTNVFSMGLYTHICIYRLTSFVATEAKILWKDLFTCFYKKILYWRDSSIYTGLPNLLATWWQTPERKSRDRKLGSHCFHTKMVSGVCYLSSEKHHTPLLFYSLWIVLNIILSFNLKPFLCEHVKSVNLFSTSTWIRTECLEQKVKPPQKFFGRGFIFQNFLPILSLLIKLLLQ